MSTGVTAAGTGFASFLKRNMNFIKAGMIIGFIKGIHIQRNIHSFCNIPDQVISFDIFMDMIRIKRWKIIDLARIIYVDVSCAPDKTMAGFFTLSSVCCRLDNDIITFLIQVKNVLLIPQSVYTICLSCQLVTFLRNAIMFKKESKR